VSRSPQEEITPSALATLVARHRDTIGLVTGASLVATGVVVSDAQLDATSKGVVIVSGLGLVYLSLGHGDAFLTCCNLRAALRLCSGTDVR
jgi:hypothetical protein